MGGLGETVLTQTDNDKCRVPHSFAFFANEWVRTAPISVELRQAAVGKNEGTYLVLPSKEKSHDSHRGFNLSKSA
jgi:hypothetical protein